VDPLTFHERAKDREDFKILAGPNLQKNIGSTRAFGFADIHQNHRAVFTTPRQEFTLLHQRVFGEMPWMALGRVSTPIHDEVSSILYFTKSTRDFTTQLGGDFGGTVSK
ncbi:MAG: hypothetical protein KDA96_27085, partial [Planctomycetaceae bacterium]|nr:hypothetical protein [Planctomycetaceae bacterium]